KARSAASNSCADTFSDESCAPSYFDVYSRSAASPRVRTSFTIEATCDCIVAELCWAGRRKDSRRSTADIAAQLLIASCSTQTSGEHLFHRQHEYRARTGLLQTFQ